MSKDPFDFDDPEHPMSWRGLEHAYWRYLGLIIAIVAACTIVADGQ